MSHGPPSSWGLGIQPWQVQRAPFFVVVDDAKPEAPSIFVLEISEDGSPFWESLV